MKYKYTVIDLSSGINPNAFCVEREDENGNKCWIPNDPANSDYQAYLRWLNNEPELEPIIREQEPTPEINIQEAITND